ncbi:hypothetical protein [Pseudactinotalea sp. Z1732]|uniref:hypothetical protein n=1 Tax=Micrococcales TaxID=85006 RepID=UPI003C7AA2F6
MADTPTPTDTNTDPAPGGATPTSQGTFVQPSAQPAPAKPEAPKPTPPPTKPESDPKPADDNGKDDKGKGSKDAVLADLARERDERQQAQSQLTAVLEALGINKNADADPEQLAADLTAQRAENAVLRHGVGIADTEALLDSRRFTDSLTNIDVTDAAAVKAHIEAFVTEHPRYATQAQQGTPGVRDAAASTPPASTEKDWLRAAIGR